MDLRCFVRFCALLGKRVSREPSLQWLTAIQIGQVSQDVPVERPFQGLPCEQCKMTSSAHLLVNS
jgi:hypothetical protein